MWRTKCHLDRFLGSFAKLRKAAISFVRSACPCTWNNLGITGRIFVKFGLWVFFRNSVKKSSCIKIWKDKRAPYLKTCVHLWSYLAQYFLEWEMFRTKVVDKIKTHISYSVTFPRKLYRLWDNVGKFCRLGQATDDNIIQRMRFACWITKATDTHSEYLILIAFLRQQLSRDCGSMLRYTYIAWLVFPVLHFSPVRFIPPTLHTHLFINPLNTELNPICQ